MPHLLTILANGANGGGAWSTPHIYLKLMLLKLP